jgi:hypothetical protein
MTKHMLRADISVKFNRWLLASVAGGCGTTFASTPKQPPIGSRMQRHRRSSRQSTHAEGPKLPLRLRSTPSSVHRAWLNPHRAR